MSESLKEYCIRYDCRELLVQWHPDKKDDLTPDEITGGSRRKVWWRNDQGHEWTSPPYDWKTGLMAVQRRPRKESNPLLPDRSRKCGFPVCAGKATRVYQ